MSGEAPTATNNNNSSSLPYQPAVGVNSIFPPSPKMMEIPIPPPAQQYSGSSPHHTQKHHKHKYDQSIRLQAVAQPLQQRKLLPGGSPQPGNNAEVGKDPGVLLSPQLGQPTGVTVPGTADTTTPKKRTQKSPEKNHAPTSMSASGNYAKDFSYQRNAGGGGGTNTNVITHRGDSGEFQYFQNNQQKQSYLNKNTEKDKGATSKLGTSRGEFNLEANAQ